jgi:hypothetical protein
MKMRILPGFAMPCSEHRVRVLLPWVRPFKAIAWVPPPTNA